MPIPEPSPCCSGPQHQATTPWSLRAISAAQTSCQQSAEVHRESPQQRAASESSVPQFSESTAPHGTAPLALEACQAPNPVPADTAAELAALKQQLADSQALVEEQKRARVASQDISLQLHAAAVTEGRLPAGFRVVFYPTDSKPPHPNIGGSVIATIRCRNSESSSQSYLSSREGPWRSHSRAQLPGNSAPLVGLVCDLIVCRVIDMCTSCCTPSFRPHSCGHCRLQL